MTDLLREQDPGVSGSISTEMFISILESIGVPLSSEEMTKLLTIYDKKGEGKLNYDDLLTEQKYIHAVSNVLLCYSIVISTSVVLFAESAIQTGSQR